MKKFGVSIGAREEELVTGLPAVMVGSLCSRTVKIGQEHVGA